jgi:hypothetical protein
MNLNEINKKTIEIWDRLAEIRDELIESYKKPESHELLEQHKSLSKEKDLLRHELFKVIKPQAESMGLVKDYDTNPGYALWKVEDAETIEEQKKADEEIRETIRRKTVLCDEWSEQKVKIKGYEFDEKLKVWIKGKE